MTQAPLVPRLAAFAVMIAAMGSLRLQFDAAGALPQFADPLHRLWVMAGYFTILTNVLVAFTMLLAALKIAIPAPWAAGLTVWIVAVGFAYHALLAGLFAPTGLAWWADQGLHSLVPALTLAWWLVFADKAVAPRDMTLWLAWPAIYCAYALTRGQMTGFWPYPFLDAGTLGWAAVAVNVAGLVLAFALLGAGALALARRSVR